MTEKEKGDLVYVTKLWQSELAATLTEYGLQVNSKRKLQSLLEEMSNYVKAIKPITPSKPQLKVTPEGIDDAIRLMRTVCKQRCPDKSDYTACIGCELFARGVCKRGSLGVRNTPRDWDTSEDI